MKVRVQVLPELIQHLHSRMQIAQAMSREVQGSSACGKAAIKKKKIHSTTRGQKPHRQPLITSSFMLNFSGGSGVFTIEVKIVSRLCDMYKNVYI